MGQPSFREFYKAQEGRIDELTLMDVEGTVVDRIPCPAKSIGKDLSDEPDVAYVLKDHESRVGEVFLPGSGTPALSILEPVYTMGEFAGILRSVIRAETIFERLIDPLLSGPKSVCGWSTGRARRILLGRKRAADDSVENVQGRRRRRRIRFYSGNRESPRTGEEGCRLCPVPIGQGRWSIAVCKDYAEIVGPIHKQARNSAIITACIVLIVACGWAYVRRTRDRRPTSRRSQYLQQIATAAEELQEREAQLRTILESTADGILVANEDGKLIH